MTKEKQRKRRRSPEEREERRGRQLAASDGTVTGEPSGCGVRPRVSRRAPLLPSGV